MKLGILMGFDKYHKQYVRACDDMGLDYEIIDFTADDWIERVQLAKCDGFLCRPPSKFQERKTMFDERLYLLNKVMGCPIYPDYDELLIYENKRMMSHWLKLKQLPHPETHVFFRKKDYFNFLKETEYPFVLKNNIGSTAKGVRFIPNKLVGKNIGHLLFGIGNTKFAFGYVAQMSGRFIKFPALGTAQRHYAITQKYESILWEWRMVRIGDSYFGHKKLLKNGVASGSKKKDWGLPPVELLHLFKKICDTGNFLSMNADIFETVDGRYLVNELQSLFGQSTPHLMLKDGEPGRYVYQDGEFRFESGVYNQHQSYQLRVAHFCELLGAGFGAK